MIFFIRFYNNIVVLFCRPASAAAVMLSAAVVARDAPQTTALYDLHVFAAININNVFNASVNCSYCVYIANVGLDSLTELTRGAKTGNHCRCYTKYLVVIPEQIPTYYILVI